MIVAIPKLNEIVAPCFEVAKQFEIAVIENEKVVSSKTVKCFASEEFMRVRLLRLHETQSLICNGIKRFYLDQLIAMGISVIPNVNDSIQNALNRFAASELKSYENRPYSSAKNNLVSHDDLVNWAKELFEKKGYSVISCGEDDDFLIDLIAEYKCPVCNKKIEVAICCGAQIYKADQEIKEFHHSAKSRFDARVYVYQANPEIAKSCEDYGLEFISPEMDEKGIDENKSGIPILKRPVRGHEKAYINL